ncbi:MAG: ABC transporter ATP-binding protein [Candidatus Omnitrophica bacterium]|nr:ABC transporter ATP-binding protein [Candidatus Omnitrophota bacterium]
MIQIENLTKRFGTKTAVDSLNLEIPKGEIFGFLGPNGAGKTTTIRMLVGLLRTTSGTIRFGEPPDQFQISRKSLEARRSIGYISDSPFLYEKLTGREHLLFMGEIYQIDQKDLRQRIDRFLDLFSLAEVADQPIEGYSHGMRQNVVMSGALLHQPKILVVDEPMVGLDPRSARIVKNLFVEEARDRGMTLFLSTHSLDVAEEVCDRVGIISRGKLVTLGSTGDLLKDAESDRNRLEQIFLRRYHRFWVTF